MQGYHWEERYNLILLRWCVGYLGDEELEAFLRQAAQHLRIGERQPTEGAGP